MAKKPTVGKSSKARSATAPPVSKDDDARTRGKPVSLFPLTFKQAIGVLVRTKPPPAQRKKVRRSRSKTVPDSS